MPRPFGSAIGLQEALRAILESVERALSTPQSLAFRCRIVLRAACSDNPSNQEIAAEFGCDRHTVGQWRERFAAKGFGGLQDAPRSGGPRSPSPPLNASRPSDRHQQDRGSRPTRQRLDSRRDRQDHRRRSPRRLRQPRHRPAYPRLSRPEAPRERLLAEQPRPELRGHRQGSL